MNTKKAGEGLNAIVGLNSLWTKEEHMVQLHFIAQTDITCLKISAAEVKAAFLERPDLLSEIIAFNVEQAFLLQERLHYRQKGRTANQICAFIRNNAVVVNKSSVVPKNITNVDMSMRLGVHQVTVARIMSFLKREKIIERTPAGLKILNPQLLNSYANGEIVPYHNS